MSELPFDRCKDTSILAARILLMTLFLIFGFMKVVSFSSTVAQMASMGLPMPTLATAIAVLMECVVGIAIVVGFYTRRLALLLALYTLAASLIGHHYWTLTGAEQAESMINFYKGHRDSVWVINGVR